MKKSEISLNLKTCIPEILEEMTNLVGWLEASVGDLSHGELLVVGLLSRDDWGVGGQREVDTGIGHQVGLELSQINVQGTIEPETEWFKCCMHIYENLNG